MIFLNLFCFRLFLVLEPSLGGCFSKIFWELCSLIIKQRNLCFVLCSPTIKGVEKRDEYQNKKSLNIIEMWMWWHHLFLYFFFFDRGFLISHLISLLRRYNKCPLFKFLLLLFFFPHFVCFSCFIFLPPNTRPTLMFSCNTLLPSIDVCRILFG